MADRVDLQAGTVTRDLTPRERGVEKLAQFMVNELGLLPPSGDGDRLSGGHGWHRTSEREREWFRALAGRQLDAMSEAVDTQRGRNGKGWVR